MINTNGNITFRFSGFPDTEMSLPIDWLANPYQSTDWQWRLHCLLYLEEGLAKDSEKNFPVLANIFTTWHNQFKGTSVENIYPKFVWHDHSTAFRARVFCKIYNYIINNNIKNLQLINDLVSSINEHLSRLLKPDFYKRHTNHGIDQSLALMDIGITLDMPNIINLGKERFLEEFNFAFTDEGIHKENSPSYHLVVLKRFADSYEMYPGIFQDKENDFIDICDKALLFMAYMIRPDGKMPIMGDTSLSRCEHLSGFLATLPNYMHYIYSATSGNEGAELPHHHWVYPESGYAIFRNPQVASNMHMIVKTGCLSHYHYHQDEGNILLHAYGEDWLIDTGHLNYNETQKERMLARSRYAHNVPVVGDIGVNYKLYDEDLRPLFKKWKVNNFSTAENAAYIDFENSILPDILLSRRIDVDNKDNIIINDKISGDFKDNKFVEVLFHFPNDKNIFIINKSIIAFSLDHMLIIQISSENFSHSYKNSGMREDLSKSSIVSWRYGGYEDSQCVHCAFHASGVVDATFSMKII